MKFTVQRSQWLRRFRDDEDESFLLHPRLGKMCCLGFLAKACGASNSEIRGKQYPSDATQVTWPIGILNSIKYNSKITDEIARINDCTYEDSDFSDAEQEQKLTELFASIGIEVVFED